MRIKRASHVFGKLLLCGAAVSFFHQHCSADSYLIYIGDEQQRDEARQVVLNILPENTEIEVKVLPRECRNRSEAQTQAEAIYAGVCELPCLVVSDEKGPYAALRLHGLSAEQIETAKKQAEAPEREPRTAEQEFSARLYLLCASLCVEDIDDKTLEKIVAECRDLLKHPLATEEQQQFIGYRCLYPALLLQYSRGYTGAHTPYTEAKLLEAIAALEAARDLNRESKIGKQAFNERERLRRARREARKYE